MAHSILSGRNVVATLVILHLLGGTAYAGDTTKPDDGTPNEVVDCRYQLGSEASEAGKTNTIFPSDDVFRPLLADPKQPQLFAMWQSTQSRLERTNTNIGAIGIGENFGFYTRRNGCNGWQMSLLTGIFVQFDLGTANAELINVDFNVGIPITWRQDN